ncbi:MAG TPA: anthranilate phosphoribosyltransferase [Isosphaeraceae bacterium]|jgi:anthranilate phosphoribosyltransferase|nr:anthranilate phosphoribosyltransferase [Isosphaeraceae bacterium]
MADPLIEALAALGSGRDLAADEARRAVAAIMDGAAGDVAIAAFLTALRVRGETADALDGAVAAVRERMTPLEPGPDTPPLLDTCGTGGDGAQTVNVSTATAIVVAACGVPVAKHGNRSASGNSGSAEVLAELGVAVEAEPAVLRRCLAELGIAFLFAPRFHPALRLAATARKQLPFRTLFNLVGPLANPARPSYQLVGVAGERPAALVAEVLARSQVRRAAVVAGHDGLDEVTLAGPTRVLWVEAGRVEARSWTPADFGLPVVVASMLRVAGPAHSADLIRRLLAAEPGPVRDVVLANAAAALLVAGRVATLSEGVARAAAAIDSGAAGRIMERWRALSRGGEPPPDGGSTP